MSQQLATTQTAPTGIERIKNYMLSPEVRERFSDMMGDNAIYYLNQVMIVVANSQALQDCEPTSILLSAMRAASLKLSVDPSQGQAWIIPYKGRATFQLGYKGVYELAMRTNLYRFINVIDIFEGEELIENRMTGMHTIGGKRTGNKVIARMLYFQLYHGFEKTFVMTVEEIAAHAERYSSSYSMKNSKWHDPIERPKMERKTVLTNGLRKWGRFNQNDADTLDAVEQGQGWNDRLLDMPEEDSVSSLPEVVHTEKQNLTDLGFDAPKAPKSEPAQAPQTAPSAPQSTPAPAVAQTAAIVPAMAYEETATVATSDGKLYRDIDNSTLVHMANAITAKLMKHGYVTDEKVKEAEYKLSAIRSILAHDAKSEQPEL